METSASTLHQIAKQESQITREIRETSKLLKASLALSSLTAHLFHKNERALASVGAMATLAFLPNAIDAANHLLSFNIDAGPSAVFSTKLLPLATGALIGETTRPVTRAREWARDRQTRRNLVQQKDISKHDLARVFAKHADIIHRKDLESHLSDTQRTDKTDPRYKILGELYGMRQKDTSGGASGVSRRVRRAREVKIKKEAVDHIAEVQIEAQRLRRDPWFIAREVGKRVADWGMGSLALAAASLGAHEVIHSTAASGAVNLVDDAAMTVGFGAALAKNKLARRTRENEKKTAQTPSTQMQELPVAPTKISKLDGNSYARKHMRSGMQARRMQDVKRLM